MTNLQIFAFVVLPLSIAAGGYVYSYFLERDHKRKHKMHPGE